MKLKITILTLFCSLFGFTQIFINEIDVDNPGVDVKEFIEIKTVNPNTSLNGYILVFYAGVAQTSYKTLDLAGYSTDVNGNFLVGNDQLVPTPNLLIANSLIQNTSGAVAIYQTLATNFPNNSTATTTNLINAISYASNAANEAVSLRNTLGLTISYYDTQATGSISKSIQRKTDGTYEYKAPTPGINNDGSGIAINYLTTTLNASSYLEGQSVIVNFATTNVVTTNTTFNISLNNGNFNSADYSGNLSVTIPSGTNTATVILTLTDDVLNEGDEEFILLITGLPNNIVSNNNSILARVRDNDFTILNFGSPLNPTYNSVASTATQNYYSTLEGLSGVALKQAIQNIIANPAVVRLHSYADMWEILKTADQNPANSSDVWCIYTEVPFSKIDQQSGSSGVGKWNREHIFCQSRGGFEEAQNDYADGIGVWNSTSASSVVDGVSDAHHIRAVSSTENSSRNNKNYGTVAGSDVYAGLANTAGSWKGDVARACFYIAVRFNGLNIVNGVPIEASGAGASGNIGDLATLLTWNSQDPRDDFEMNRNNYIETWQKNRNPFIDYPTLANYVYGANYGQPWFAALSNQSFNESTVAVYPNPATEYIIVSGIVSKTKVEIFSVTGQNLLSEITENEQVIPINFKAGLYFVNLENENGKITKKIIVK